MDPHALRQATRAEHEATEALMPLGVPDLTLRGYIGVLQILYPVVAGWETWSAGVAPPALGAMLQQRRRSHLLAQDLQCLGAGQSGDTPKGIDWGYVVAEPGSSEVSFEGRVFEAALLGAMYVMEGSTLGGRFIARHVEALLGFQPGVGNAYFRGHGEATGSMWREVTAQIAAVPEELSSVLIGAAKRTFEAFGEALREGLAAQATVHP